LEDTPDDAALREQYKQRKEIFQKLVDEVKFTIKDPLKGAPINIAAVYGRVKDIESFLKKTRQKDYTDPFVQMKDIAGVRVVCLFREELDVIGEKIAECFDIRCIDNKTEKLGTDRMGYHSVHYIVNFPATVSGARYDYLKGLVCEIQVRTIMHDAWAQSYHTFYKNPDAIPDRIQRQLHNISAILEAAQGIFDEANRIREDYIRELDSKKSEVSEFLSQPIDREALTVYTKWKYPEWPVNTVTIDLQQLLLSDLDRDRYITLGDLDKVVERARPAVERYHKESPRWFECGTDFLTKSLGFADEGFRAKHRFGRATREAFSRLEHLVRPPR
jgi:putative GTP pyrophosphokinase